MCMNKILITGGAGFIGSAVVRYLLTETSCQVINVDKLTYAGNTQSLASVAKHKNYHFIQADICDSQVLAKVFNEYQPDAVMHLAAESHVDRSIDGPSAFIQTNIVGTYTLLEQAKQYWLALEPEKQTRFRFHHISTDEVYGDLEDTGLLFTETTAYDPSSPYSASKASSDHLVRAWQRTYGLPCIITNCSNNYGPYHFPEKLIPLVILNALEGKPLPVYGDGSQIRDWLYVDDHASALYKVITTGKVGETYNIGGHNEINNIEVVKAICSLLDELAPIDTNVVIKSQRNLERTATKSYAELITYVADRPGHDLRYAIDASKIQRELNWQPNETFQSGLRKTVLWYLDNQAWCKAVQNGSYQRQRLGQQ